MSEFYEFEGTTYEVSPGRLEEFMERFPDATKSRESLELRSIDPKTGQPIPEGDLLIGDGILTEDQINEQKRHAEAEQASREVLKDFYSKTTGIPKFMLPYVTNFTGGTAGLVSGLFKSVEATAENIIGMSAQEQREDGVNPISAALDSFHDFTDAFDTKYYDKQGRSLQVDELLERGEYSKAIQIGSEQAAESAPSMIASAYNPMLGGALMGVSTAGTTYFDDLENRPDAVAGDIIKNSLIAGSSEFLTEWAGGYAFRRINKIGSKLKGTGNAEKVAKDFTKGYINKFITRTLGSGIGEATTESVNSMVQDLGSNWVYDEAFDKKQFVSNVINSAVPALLLGGFGGGMSTLNKQDRKDLYKFVADGKWKRDYMDIGAQIYEKSNDYKAADDKQKVRIKEELDALQAKKQKHEQDLFDSFENLTDKELTDIAKNIDKINENAGIVGNKDFSETTQKQREQETIDLLQKNYNILGREYTGEDIEIDKIISESLKASERLDPMLKKLKGINREDLETQVINTDKELQALPENIRKQVEKGDGYFLAKDKDGKAKIYINSKIAGLSGATNVVGHELLHYMISRKFKTNNKSMKPFIDNLKSYLQENHADVYSRLQTRIDNFYTNPDGTIKDGALEEYLTIFSDLVATQKIDLKENESKGFRDNVKDIVLGFGVGEVKLDTAQDFIKFIRAYNKNINRKGLLGKLMGTKILDVKLKSKTLKEGKPETIGKKSMSAAEIKQVEERVTEIGLTYNFEGGKDLWDEKGADQAIDEMKRDGTIDNLIASKYKVRPVPEGFINDVFNKLIPDIRGFNPEINNDFGGYLGPRINFRAGDIYKEIYEKKGPATVPTEARTKEGEVKVQIAAETDAAMEAFETEDLSPEAQTAKLKELESQMRKDLELSKEKKEKVMAAARKIFGLALPSINNPRVYRKAVAKAFKVELKSEIQDIFGREKEYNAFLEKYIPVFHNLIDKETWIQIERLAPKDKKIFAEKRRITKVVEVRKLQEQGLISKDIKPASGPSLITLLPTPSTRQIMAFYRGKYKNPDTGKVETMEDILGYTVGESTFGTRKDALAEAVLVELGFDASVDVLNNEREVAERRRGVDEIINKEQLENDIELIAKALDRDPNLKFSKSAIVLNQFDDLLSKIEDKGFKNVFNIDGTPKVNFYGKRYLEEVYEPVYELGNKGGLFTAKEVNKQLKELFKGLKIKADNTLGDTSERAVFELFERADFIAPGFQLSEKKVNIPAFHTFVGGKFQSADIMFVLKNAVQVAMEVKFAVDGTVNAGKIGVESFNSKNGKYTIDESLPENVKKVIKKSYDKTMKVVLEMQDLLINEFGYPKSLDLSKQKFLMDENGVATSPNGKVVYAMHNNRPIWHDEIKKLKAKSNQTTKDSGDVVTYHYNKKGNFYITFVGAGKGKGIYYIGSDPLSVSKELGIEKLESNKDGFLFKTRFLPASIQSQKDGIKKKIGYKLRLNGESVVNTNNIAKTSKFNIKSEKDVKTFKKAVNKSIYANIKHGKSSKTLNNAIKMSRSIGDPKGITVLDFDDTLATTKSLVKFTRPDGTTGTLNAEEYASTYEDLLDQGYTFDFSDFNKVVKGKLAPLFNKAMKLQGKFGPENMFVLTARPPAAQKAIFDFLKANGLNIPLKNITGLGNSTAEAKALWIADKVGEGYNDFYFADDALQNVQAVKNMLDQFDVKSKVQQAKVKFSKSMNDNFNDILENVTGIESKKRFSAVKARKRGAGKGKFRFFIPPSHEDFVGLLYNFIGKGKEGNKHRDFFEESLIKPLLRADRELNTARQSIANDYRSLNKQFKNVKKKLNKKTPDGDFTYQDAIRVYLWNKHGHDIPGLTPTDQQNLVDLVKSDPELQNYAETLNIISKREDYVKPSEGWEVTDIRMDLDDATGRIGRKEFFAEFLENAGIILSPENLNKIEAAFGPDMVSALKDMLYRIENGRNRPSGSNKIVNGFMNWFNASVAATMFINVRSVVLQQMSLVNFINYSDNNVFAAAKAFANQKQYWTDWATLFNSDFMKQRRGGIMTDVNGAELAESLRGAKNNPIVLLGKLLQMGFKPTQIGDNVAIATGGATYYRNRINTYLKQGLS